MLSLKEKGYGHELGSMKKNWQQRHYLYILYLIYI